MTPESWVPMLWRGSAPYEKLRGTPINCLVTEDPQAARKNGFEAVRPGENPQGVATITGRPWPSVKLSTGLVEGAAAGPTGVPWVDSNGWAVRLARMKDPSKAVWVAPEMPKDTSMLRPEAYMVAVADAAAYGGRWVVSVNPADEAWEKVVSTLAFFEKHSRWRAYQPLARLGIVSDFAGPNEFLCTEVLNLMSRRPLQFQIIEKSKATHFAGLTGLLYLDDDEPSGELRGRLLEFAAKGGTLIASPKAAKALGKAAVQTRHWDDPYLIAGETHTVLSRRQDLVRLYNPGSAGCYLTASADGKTALMHLVNYTGRPGSLPMTVALLTAYRKARLWTPDAGSPKELKPVVRTAGIELELPPFSVYAALELEA